MTARPNRPAADDVRGLMAELSELVDDLGLQVAPPGPAHATAPAPSPDAPGDVQLLGEAQMPQRTFAGHAVDMRAAAADVAAEIGAVVVEEIAVAPPPALWPTFTPTVPDETQRRWSPRAAMMVIEPAAPPPGHRMTSAYAHVDGRWRPHVFTVVTAVAVIVAALVFTFTRLDLGHTSGPAQAVAHPDFTVTDLRTVSAASAAGVAGAPTSRRFPSTASAIYLDVTYGNASPGDSLRIIVDLQPAQKGGNITTIRDLTRTGFNGGGHIGLTIAAPRGGFAPGSYTVRALHDGNLDQTWAFQVDAR